MRAAGPVPTHRACSALLRSAPPAIAERGAGSRAEPLKGPARSAPSCHRTRTTSTSDAFTNAIRCPICTVTYFSAPLKYAWSSGYDASIVGA